MLRAIADAAGHDPEVERVYHGLIERFVVATTTRIEADIAPAGSRAWTPGQPPARSSG